MSLENKHFIIKQEVSLSQDFSEPLLNCMFICLSKRKKQDSDFSCSFYHKSLSLFFFFLTTNLFIKKHLMGLMLHRICFGTGKMDSLNKYLLRTYHMLGADGKVISPRMPSSGSPMLSCSFHLILTAPRVRQAEQGSLSLSPRGGSRCLDQGHATLWEILENMAQSCAF